MGKSSRYSLTFQLISRFMHAVDFMANSLHVIIRSIIRYLSIKFRITQLPKALCEVVFPIEEDYWGSFIGWFNHYVIKRLELFKSLPFRMSQIVLGTPVYRVRIDLSLLKKGIDYSVQYVDNIDIIMQRLQFIQFCFTIYMTIDWTHI